MENVLLDYQSALQQQKLVLEKLVRAGCVFPSLWAEPMEVMILKMFSQHSNH
uniref:Uncharacterized protein n=1 Tax=Anguilla anguilla TaxID=7936 RepID=A0A0E9SWL3_ANGAN